MKKFIVILTCIFMISGFTIITNAEDTISGNVHFSTNQISVTDKDNKFTVDIVLSSDTAFSSAEFGLKPDGNIKLDYIKYSNKITASKIPVLEKDDIWYFGFFGADNKYSGNLTVCTLGFIYEDNNPVNISIAETNISVVKANGNVQKIYFQSGDSISVKKTEEHTDNIKGDINSDSTVNISDLIILKKFLLNIQELNESQTANADINSDLKLNAFDFLLLKQKLCD